MTIEQRIAELMAESEKFEEVVTEGSALGDELAQDAEEAEVPATEEVPEVVAETKIDVTADVAALVEGEELSEEFKVKAATIFEAAVVTRVKEEAAKLEEQYTAKFEAQLEEAVATEVEGLIEKVDGYLSYMAEEWMKDNELALDSGIKAELAENFMAKLKTVFEESYIEMPEEKLDVVAEMEELAQELDAKLQESEARNIELHKALSEVQRSVAVQEATKDLTDVEADKFTTLAEELSFESADNFSAKLKVIRESYFAKKPTEVTTPMITESTIVEEKSVTSSVAAYANFLSRK